MPAFIEAGQLDRSAPGKGVMVTTGHNTVVLFKADSGIHAIEAWCLRCGAFLAEGSLDGRIVACGGCDWRYDIATGSVVGVPALRLMIYDVRVVGGQIIVSDA